jgi:hypothetical protein
MVGVAGGENCWTVSVSRQAHKPDGSSEAPGFVLGAYLIALTLEEGCCSFSQR